MLKNSHSGGCFSPHLQCYSTVLHGVPFKNQLAPVLHIKLGVINGAIQHLRSHHLQFDSSDPTAEAAATARRAELAKLELIFQKEVADLTVLLDGTSADGHLAASAELTRAENTGDYGRFIEIAEASVSGLLASAADAKDGPRDRTVQGRTHRLRLVDEAATAKLTEAASRISSVLESFQGAIKARAYAAEEHRAFDATGGNGSDITRAFDMALADAGIKSTPRCTGPTPLSGATALSFLTRPLAFYGPWRPL